MYIVRIEGVKAELFISSKGSEQPRKVTVLPTGIVGGLCLDPAENNLYYTKLDGFGHQLMLVKGL